MDPWPTGPWPWAPGPWPHGPRKVKQIAKVVQKSEKANKISQEVNILNKNKKKSHAQQILAKTQKPFKRDLTS